MYTNKMSGKNNNKNGFASVLLGVYLLVILIIMGSTLYGFIYITSASSAQQLKVIQNNYYLERGIYYAVKLIKDHVTQNGETSYTLEDPGWPTDTPDESVHIKIDSGQIVNDPQPPHYVYKIESSTPTAQADRPQKTVTAEFDRGNIISYGTLNK